MILPTHTQRIIRHKITAAAHLIAAEYDCELSDVLDIAVTAPFTPSQPGDTSRSHAPAAQTGEGACPSSLKPSSSVDLSGLAAHEQGPIPSPSPMANAP